MIPVDPPKPPSETWRATTIEVYKALLRLTYARCLSEANDNNLAPFAIPAGWYYISGANDEKEINEALVSTSVDGFGMNQAVVQTLYNLYKLERPGDSGSGMDCETLNPKNSSGEASRGLAVTLDVVRDPMKVKPAGADTDLANLTLRQNIYFAVARRIAFAKYLTVLKSARNILLSMNSVRNDPVLMEQINELVKARTASKDIDEAYLEDLQGLARTLERAYTLYKEGVSRGSEGLASIVSSTSAESNSPGSDS
jgi:hypothetical protein